MSAPTPTARQDPNGTRLGDGYQTLVTFATAPDLAIWEESVTPISLEADDPVDISSQHNVTYRTYHTRRLVRGGEMSFTGFFDPAVYVDVASLLNVNTTITVTFPDTSTFCFYGYLKNFKPGELVEGTPPKCTVTIQPTFTDPSDCSEAGPVYTAGTGTANPC